MDYTDETDYNYSITLWENQIKELSKENKSLKAELTYWKDTAEFYLRELNKTKQNT